MPTPVIAANRALPAALIATNFFGQNTPAIAATETKYYEFWAQNAAAMYGCGGSSVAGAQLTDFAQSAEVANPTGPADQAIAVFKAQSDAVGSNVSSWVPVNAVTNPGSATLTTAAAVPAAAEGLNTLPMAPPFGNSSAASRGARSRATVSSPP